MAQCNRLAMLNVSVPKFSATRQELCGTCERRCIPIVSYNEPLDRSARDGCSGELRAYKGRRLM